MRLRQSLGLRQGISLHLASNTAQTTKAQLGDTMDYAETRCIGPVRCLHATRDAEEILADPWRGVNVDMISGREAVSSVCVVL